MSEDLDKRVLRRFLEAGDVVPIGRPPKAPQHTIEIGGKKYALSPDGGPLGNPDDEGPEWSGGARLVRGPSHGEFKYLWVYDTDKQIVAMWRAHDGNEKVFDRAQHQMARIVRLDKKRQINRVSTAEFHKIEAAMRKRAADNERGLREWVEREKTRFQRDVDARTQEFFDRQVAPRLDRAIADIDSGLTPLGFKPHNVDLPVRRQMIAFVMGRIFKQDFTPEKVERYLKEHGLDPDAPERDNQAAYWAIGDVQEKAFEKYL